MYMGREDRHIQRKSKNAKTFILTVVKIDIYTGNAVLQVRIDIYIGNAILQKAARFDRHIQRKQKNTISIDIYLGNWSVKIDMYNGKVIRWDNIHL